LKDDKIIGFPNSAKVPTVGQRLCPILSKALPTQKGPGMPIEIGTLQVMCSGATCRLWEWCSGKIMEQLIDALEHGTERRGI
jgi:hypothetical protein